MLDVHLDVLVNFWTCYQIFVDVIPFCKNSNRQLGIEIFLHGEVKQRKELTSFHNERKGLLDGKQIL
jgi:hypothetical protein